MHTCRPRGVHSIALVLSLAIAWLPHADHAAVGYLMAYLLYHCTTSAFWDFGTTTPDPVRGDLTPRQSFFRWQKVDRPWHCWGLPWSIILQRKRNTRLYTIAGVSIDFIPLGTAVILNRRTLITAANYLDPYLTRQRDVRVWCLGRGGDHILPYRYRVWRVRRIFPRSINPEHCHGIKCEHVPRHDIAIVHTMDPIYLYNQIYERYMYAFRAYICRKYQKLKSYVWFTGSGYEYDLHIKENYKIFIHMTPLFDKLKDCSIYLPKWWGKFICVANDVDFSGISNGGGFFSTDYHYSSTSGFEWDNLLFGIACFEIRYNDDRIWVFTDLRYYIDYVKIYANITRAAYYEYAYPEWSAYDQGWQSIYSGHFGVRGAGGGGMFGDVNISAILDSLSVSYDKRVRPNYGGPPVDVGVTMYVLSISSLSEVKMDFTLDFYFRQFWTDPRLAYKKRTGVETLSVGSEFIRNIWVPDTFFVNEKQSYFHIATTSNEFIRIHHSGSITRSIRLTITASCPMDLQYFPMDRQLCNIEIESFGYTMRDIRYKWNEGPNSVGVSSEVSLPQFKVLGHRQRAMEISLTTGNYSRLACEIQFVRSMGYYLIQIYIPSGLIVIISWVSFWLNRNATPARVSLGVTTVLTMTTLMSSTNAALPKISYVKSIDVYLGTCFVMVFASLLEYATVGYMAKRIQMRKQRFTAVQKIAAEKKIQIDGPPGPSEPLPPPRTSTLNRPLPPSRSSLHFVKQEVRYKAHDPKVYSKGGTLENTINGSRAPPPPPPAPQPDEEAGPPPHLIHASKGINKLLGTTPSDIDKYSRIVFPVCFVCFNLMYWIIYLHVSDVVADDLVLLGEEN